MPQADVGQVRLYYELHGEGTPLVLIEGIGYASWMWFRQVEALAARHLLIVFDSRGVGGSDKPETDYTIRDMADDLAGLLDTLGIDRAHVLGVSMGGFIAQEFALANPDRVRGLILACTAFGGRGMVPIPTETQRLMVPDVRLPTEQRLRVSMAVAFAPGYVEANPDVFDTVVRLRVASPVSLDAWLRQARAVAGFDTSSRLGSIQAPTLILHGDRDRVVPVDNADLLSRRMPHAELQVLTGGGHLFFIEQADQFNGLALDFLARVDAAEADRPSRD